MGGTIEVRVDEFDAPGKDDKSALSMREARYVRITIKDQGGGIAEENIEKIFDPYFSTKDRGVEKGMGMGLAITHSVIRSHDGYVRVESRLGQGTDFHIYLPVSREKVLSKERPEPKREAVTGRARALVMDDEEHMRSMVRLMLLHMGYEEVATAKDGAEAIEQFTAARESGEPFDVVILDLTIEGGMGGKGVIKRLMEIEPSVRAIVSSGYSNDPVMSNFEAHGFLGALAKPYTFKDLSDALAAVAGSC